MKTLTYLTAIVLIIACASCKKETIFTASSPAGPDPFFTYVDTGTNLPPDKIYPQGRIFPYMGYSGNNQVDATNGFSVGGHHYGPQSDQKNKLENAVSAGLPYIYGIGMDGSFVNAEKPIEFTGESLREEITRQVREVMGNPGITWWYVRPEELRMWRKNENDYLRIVTETIRATDPMKRPVSMYDPNHRTSDGLIATGTYLDIISKGCYVNLSGFTNDRVWVRWSMEQEIQACKALKEKDGRERIPLVMPQLSKDPDDPALDAMIPAWVRHDVYLGLISGARGVSIWSLFKRADVRRTHGIFYEAYARTGRELTGDLQLGRVFLFGEERNDLKIEQMTGPKEVALFTGPRNKLEDGSLSDEERVKLTHSYPALSSKEITYAGKRYLFLCNSSTNEITCRVGNIPLSGVTVEELFSGQQIQPESGHVQRPFGPWQTECLRIITVVP